MYINYYFMLKFLVLTKSPIVNEYELELSRLNRLQGLDQSTYSLHPNIGKLDLREVPDIETAIVFFRKRMKLIDEVRVKELHVKLKSGLLLNYYNSE